MEKEIELLNCPFCGSDDVSLEWMYEPDDEFGTDLALAPQGSDFYIQCNGCSMASDNYMSPEVVAKLWNTRAARTDGWNVVETEADFPDSRRQVWVTVRGRGEVSTNSFPSSEENRGGVFVAAYSAWMEMIPPSPYIPTPAEPDSEGDL